MRARKYADNRADHRNGNLTGQLPGRLVDPDTGEQIGAHALDVSRTGMAVLIDFYIPPGEYLELVFPEYTLRFDVMYCALDPDTKETHRCGLMLHESTVDVEGLFAKHGCIRTGRERWVVIHSNHDD